VKEVAVELWETSDVASVVAVHAPTVLGLFADGTTAVSLDPLHDAMIVWTLGEQEGKKQIPMRCERITSLAVAGADSNVLIGVGAGEVERWDCASGARRFAVKAHSQHIVGIAPHANGRHAATASADGVLSVLRVDDGSVVATLHCDSAITACVALPSTSDDDVRFAAGDQSGRVHVVRLR
jgi:WD40 repeat protein